jgi:hypothetical protein
MAGLPFAVIGRTYGLGRDSLRNHKRNHVDKEAWSRVPEPQRRILSTVERVEQSAAILEAQIAHRLKTGADMLGAMGELRRTLELVAKLKRELDESPQLNLLVAPDYLGVRAAIMAALDAYPEARAEVAARLAAYEVSSPMVVDSSQRDLRPALVARNKP